MNTIEAKRLFLETHGKALMTNGDYFRLTKLTSPFNGVLYRETEKLYFTLDIEKKCWIKRATKINKKT